MMDPPTNLNLSATQQPRILGADFFTYCLAVLVVILRFISRKLSKAPYWWDDWLMIPAVLFATVMCFVSVPWMLHHGFGKHIWAAEPDAPRVSAVGLFIAEITYPGILCSVKFSILAFYWRIFKVSCIRIPIYILGSVTTCWGIAVILVTAFQCTPLSSFWDHEGTCGVDTQRFFYGNAIPNIITDIALLILPMPFIWRLHLPQTRKVLLTCIFILCIFVVAVSITRLVYIVTIDFSSPDVTWNLVNVAIWTCIEPHIGIVCACLPSLRPLLSYISTGSPEILDLGNAASGLSKARPLWVSNNNMTTIRAGNDRSSTGSDQNCKYAESSDMENGEVEYIHVSMNQESADARLEEVHYPGKNGGIRIQMDFDVRYT